MTLTRAIIFSLLAALWAAPVTGQNQPLRVDTEHPRIFLGARRLKLLRRERERQSLRWNQFNLLMAGKAPMPEPGFADALYYQVSGDREAGDRAVAWALGAGADLRQLALVFDWCQPLLSEAQSKALAAKLARAMEKARADSSAGSVRSRFLAAVALAGHVPQTPERELEDVVHSWWEGRVAPALNQGKPSIRREDSYALMEILHATRDNLDLDLREGCPHFFRDLPMVHLLSYYPATYPAAENEYRIPATLHPTPEPDLRRAVLSRAAELSMVAYDTNEAGSQMLQGWLMNDNFLLRGTFGAPYEFLWANPYQPGLSYYHAPLVWHDSLLGRLFVRSDWEESASWLGFFDGEAQLFEEGRVKVIDARMAAEPLAFPAAVIVFGAHATKFKVAVENAQPVFVVGLKPGENYAIEVDDEEMDEAPADPGGILALDLPQKAETGVRFRKLDKAASQKGGF
jgi:hypothetical protein